MPRLHNFKITKINNRWKLKLPDFRAKQWANEWEKKRLDTMYVEIKKDDVVYYVGAECGDIPALIQKWGAKLYLFEPSHTSWPIIKKIWEANKLERPVGLYAMFASDKTELKPSKVDENIGEGWKFGEDNWPEFASKEVKEDINFAFLSQQADGIPQVKIDDVVSLVDPTTGIGTMIPDVISIDVEGAELQVLKGAELTIESFMPKIFVSVHPEILEREYNTNQREVRDWIIDKGYKEVFLDYQHEMHLLYLPIKPTRFKHKKRKK